MNVAEGHAEAKDNAAKPRNVWDDCREATAE